jgi:hypothetical protein
MSEQTSTTIPFRALVAYGGSDDTVAACRAYIAAADAAGAPETEWILVGKTVYQLGRLRGFLAGIDANLS